MKKIEVSGHMVLDLDYNPIPDTEFGKIIGRVLGNHKEGNLQKNVDLARRFYKCEDIILDKEDLKMVRNAIESAGRASNPGQMTLSPLAAAQILDVLDEAKDVEEKKSANKDSP